MATLSPADYRRTKDMLPSKQFSQERKRKKKESYRGGNRTDLKEKRSMAIRHLSKEKKSMKRERDEGRGRAISLLSFQFPTSRGNVFDGSSDAVAGRGGKEKLGGKSEGKKKMHGLAYLPRPAEGGACSAFALHALGKGRRGKNPEKRKNNECRRNLLFAPAERERTRIDLTSGYSDRGGIKKLG